MDRAQTTPFIFCTPHRLQTRSRTPPLPKPPPHAPPAGLRQRLTLEVLSESRSALDALSSQLNEERATTARLRAELCAAEEEISVLARRLDDALEVIAEDRPLQLAGPTAADLRRAVDQAANAAREERDMILAAAESDRTLSRQTLAAARGAIVDLTRELRVAKQSLVIALEPKAPLPAPPAGLLLQETAADLESIVGAPLLTDASSTRGPSPRGGLYLRPSPSWLARRLQETNTAVESARSTQTAERGRILTQQRNLGDGAQSVSLLASGSTRAGAARERLRQRRLE